MRSLKPKDLRPKLASIQTNGRHLAEISREVVKVLEAANTPPTIFTRAGQPVRVGAENSGPQIFSVDLPYTYGA